MKKNIAIVLTLLSFSSLATVKCPEGMQEVRSTANNEIESLANSGLLFLILRFDAIYYTQGKGISTNPLLKRGTPQGDDKFGGSSYNDDSYYLGAHIDKKLTDKNYSRAMTFEKGYKIHITGINPKDKTQLLTANDPVFKYISPSRRFTWSERVRNTVTFDDYNKGTTIHLNKRSPPDYINVRKSNWYTGVEGLFKNDKAFLMCTNYLDSGVLQFSNLLKVPNILKNEIIYDSNRDFESIHDNIEPKKSKASSRGINV